MKAISTALAGLVLFGTAEHAGAQTVPAPTEHITVSSLLNQGYDLAGTLSPPTGGAGLLLRKGAQIHFCYAVETPQSKTVATQYCKPVE
jgi:hypothetical protein